MGPGSCISCSSTAGPRGSATGLPIPARQGAAVCKLIKLRCAANRGRAMAQIGYMRCFVVQSSYWSGDDDDDDSTVYPKSGSDTWLHVSQNNRHTMKIWNNRSSRSGQRRPQASEFARTTIRLHLHARQRKVCASKYYPICQKLGSGLGIG